MLQSAAVSLLDALSYGLLLFMLSAGLTLIFSMMGVLNFAHASFYMLGAYLAYTIGAVSGFWVALCLAPVLVGVLGALVERFGLRRLHRDGQLTELLFTFGLALVIEQLVELVWGRSPVPWRFPALLRGPAFPASGVPIGADRLFTMAVALVMLGLLWLLVERTRIGLIVRAALTHPTTVGSLGHDVPRIHMLVFAAGCALAGLAGVIGGAMLVTGPDMAATLGPIVFVVIVIGGMGSLAGAFLASLLVALVQTFAVASDLSMADLFGRVGIAPGSEVGTMTLAQLAPMLPYILMVAILIVRPRGLMGQREA